MTKSLAFIFACVAFASTEACAVSSGNGESDSIDSARLTGGDPVLTGSRTAAVFNQEGRVAAGQIIIKAPPDPNPPVPGGYAGSAPNAVDRSTWAATGQIIIRAPPDPNPPTPGGYAGNAPNGVDRTTWAATGQIVVGTKPDPNPPQPGGHAGDVP